MESQCVMAGLVPAIHVLLVARKTWVPGTRPGMTTERPCIGATVKCGASLTAVVADIVASASLRFAHRPQEPAVKPFRVSIVQCRGSPYEVGRAQKLAFAATPKGRASHLDGQLGGMSQPFEWPPRRASRRVDLTCRGKSDYSRN